MSFASLAQPEVADVIQRFSNTRDITLIVGAGASMEADLPSWPTLIQRLLSTVADARADLPSSEAKHQWAEHTMDGDGLLGAGAIVEVMADAPLDRLVPEALYGPEGAPGYLPGPIAKQVAYLRGCFGERLEILTTNYDDLIEEAVAEAGTARFRVRSYIQDRSLDQRADGTVAVIHLHGLAGRQAAPKAIVLTEEEYHRMQRGTSWQERLVTRRLQESTCLFVGMSLTDPNLIRYLYGYRQSELRRHAAIFVRQGEPSLDPDVRSVREQAAAARWGRCGVEAVFVDHFADAAQLLYEVGYRRKVGDVYESVGDRAQALIESLERWLLLADRDQDAFANRQVVLSEWLRTLLYSLVREGLGGSDVPDDEKLALALWLVSQDGTEVTGWAHSDRAHQDPKTIAPIPLDQTSQWVAIQTVCRGARVESDRDIYASRWKFVRGLPLIMEEPSRVPVGCLTISSTKSGDDSVLTQMPSDRRAAMHGAFISAARDLFGVAIGSAAAASTSDDGSSEGHDGA
jgi:hypothetical protein